MARHTTRIVKTKVRIGSDEAEALARARADGHSTSEIVRRGIRLVAASYYRKKKHPPSTGLMVSNDPKLGEESELFKQLKNLAE
jgi:hypothetical protein